MIDWDRLPSRVKFGVSHWPVPAERLPDANWLNLHGHIHNRPTGPLRMNVSVEAIDYQPKSLRELVTPELLDDLVRRRHGVEGLLSRRSDMTADDIHPQSRPPGP